MKGKAKPILIAAAAVLVVAVGILVFFLVRNHRSGAITVGFIYDNAETTPYSYSFLMAQEAVESEFQGKVKVMMFSNIMENEVEGPLNVLIENNCDLVFTNGYGDFRTLAAQHPEIEFCQVSNEPYPESEALDNYHTFKGEIYQGRYASGVVAGIKLKQLIDAGEIRPEEALVGFVAAFPDPEVVSGYSAFILGVRSVVPEATMRVRYIYTWDSYTKEKQCADRLLNEGCIIISQHSDTVGPAVACEEYLRHPAFHVGYNIDMTDVAPNTSLVSARINWTPYVTQATQAVLERKNIEKSVDGRVHPINDMSAGFEKEWVALTRLNTEILPAGTEDTILKLIDDFEEGKIEVFKGDYICTSVEDEDQWIDLHEGFIENEFSSIPAFHYIIQDVVKVES